SLLDRMARIVGGDAGQHEALAALGECYVACRHRAAALHEHAQSAPQAASTAALEQLAREEEAQAQQLRDALQAAQLAPPTLGAAPTGGSGRNHWARIVEDLEAHRQAQQQYRILAMRFAESAPERAALFATLCEQEHAHCEWLRDLIARA